MSKFADRKNVDEAEMIIIATVVNDNARLEFLPEYVGSQYLQFERLVYLYAEKLSDGDYGGGFWEYFQLSNGGMYMRPEERDNYLISAENGFHGEVTKDVFGVIVCLYALNTLIWMQHEKKHSTNELVRKYHLLRDFAALHDEHAVIFRAID